MVRAIKMTAQRLRAELARREAEHGMPSAVFYERFTAGQAGDSPDVVEWAWLCEIAMKAGHLASPARA
jgi:hypothetical protein